MTELDWLAACNPLGALYATVPVAQLLHFLIRSNCCCCCCCCGFFLGTKKEKSDRISDRKTEMEIRDRFLTDADSSCYRSESTNNWSESCCGRIIIIFAAVVYTRISRDDRVGDRWVQSFILILSARSRSASLYLRHHHTGTCSAYATRLLHTTTHSLACLLASILSYSILYLRKTSDTTIFLQGLVLT